jgi:hypothetical protein
MRIRERKDLQLHRCPGEMKSLVSAFDGQHAVRHPAALPALGRCLPLVPQNSGIPLRDPDGTVVRWCVLLTDIDERKHAEDALRRSERNLKRIIRHQHGAGVVCAPGRNRRTRVITGGIGHNLPRKPRVPSPMQPAVLTSE